ncbi:Jag N-terminal domain-containing protein [Sulfurimonas sp.]
MIKIEAITLEEAYQNAASSLECSVTELKIEVVQSPTKGFLGLFKKSAIIVAIKETSDSSSDEEVAKPKKQTQQKNPQPKKEEQKKPFKKNSQKRKPKEKEKLKEKEPHNILNDTIMPASFVSTQDDEDEYGDVTNYLADYDEEDESEVKNISEIAKTVKDEINVLFDLTCFKIDSIDVSVHDENTLLIEFKGEDAALLIGKEGYRYKALSYMIFNWLNTKYQIQLRLEIAEFLKNQEESISKYLVGVCENIEKDGRAQTKILDGVLVQIALKELRERYPDKYIVIRSTRDGLKYIIVNDYHSN